MKRLKYLILIVLLFVLFVPAQPARADMAPPASPLLTGLQPFQYQDTKVQMVYERVELELVERRIPNPDSDAEYPIITTNQVLVKASFVMHNRGKTAETMQSIFPMESLRDCQTQALESDDSFSYTQYKIKENSFEIKVNGQDVPTQKVVTPHPYKDQWNTKSIISSSCTEMHWIGFDVTFPVDTDVLVTVNYLMDGYTDFMENFDYVLETGAGWYGPIERAYIIAKLPYLVNTDNILEATTPGYQMLYNEIFWSFQNIEPESKNNIRISIISPGAWADISSLQQQVKENPALPDVWLKLAQDYQYVATWHGYNIRDGQSYSKAMEIYDQGIAANPNNAVLPAEYALVWLDEISPYRIRVPRKDELRPIVSLVNRALALDPNNATAHFVWGDLKSFEPDVTFTPPPTIPPTATSALSETPTPTPLPSMTLSMPTSAPSQTAQMVEVTVVQTRIVTALPAATTTLSKPPAPDAAPVKGSESSLSWLAWSALLLIGFAGGVLFSRRKKP